ncbi:MAG: hypothetical protein V3V10_01325 [Planctomycetota bacterium]
MDMEQIEKDLRIFLDGKLTGGMDEVVAAFIKQLECSVNLERELAFYSQPGHCLGILDILGFLGQRVDPAARMDLREATLESLSPNARPIEENDIEQ